MTTTTPAAQALALIDAHQPGKAFGRAFFVLVKATHDEHRAGGGDPDFDGWAAAKDRQEPAQMATIRRCLGIGGRDR